MHILVLLCRAMGHKICNVWLDTLPMSMELCLFYMEQRKFSSLASTILAEDFWLKFFLHLNCLILAPSETKQNISLRESILGACNPWSGKVRLILVASTKKRDLNHGKKRKFPSHWLQIQIYAIKPVMFGPTMVGHKNKSSVKFPLLFITLY